MSRRHRRIALEALLRRVADESDVSALAVIDAKGRTVAGVGPKEALRGLARLAKPVAEAEPCPELDALTEGTDVLARAIGHGDERVYLAAFGQRVRRMVHAGEEIARILRVA